MTRFAHALLGTAVQNNMRPLHEQYEKCGRVTQGEHHRAARNGFPPLCRTVAQTAS
jgi:hypothetical protein